VSESGQRTAAQQDAQHSLDGDRSDSTGAPADAAASSEIAHSPDALELKVLGDQLMSVANEELKGHHAAAYYVKQAARFLFSQSATASTGEVVVPREPTAEIIEAICKGSTECRWPDDFGECARTIRRQWARESWRNALDSIDSRRQSDG